MNFSKDPNLRQKIWGGGGEGGRGGGRGGEANVSDFF